MDGLRAGRTDGLPRSWEGQRKCQLTKQHQLRCPTGCPRETEGRKLRISLFCPPTVTREEEEDKYLGSLCAWNPVSRRSPAPPVFAQGIPHPRLLRATHRNPPPAVAAAQLRNWKNVWLPFCAFGRPVGRLLALRGRAGCIQRMSFLLAAAPYIHALAGRRWEGGRRGMPSPTAGK